ncbi:MAG: pilus assembly protein N-terminal domain-containing protein [Acidobacteria bacterium]|nr:pilus assembly protein N-terminal domain-containing protein [Acidobacteriota bacterium]
MSMFMSLTRMRPRAFQVALPVFIIIILVAAPQAQVQSVSYSSDGRPAPAASTSVIDLLVGRSTVLNVGAAISRVSLTVPDVADALVTAPQQILIHGKAPGTISLFVWEKTGAIRTFEVTVRRDLSVLSNQLRQLFPGEPISVTGSGKDVVLSGKVSTPYVVEKAAEVAIAYAEKKENVVNLLKMQEGIASNQVMLRVRFAEVSRSALQELGASYFANNYESEWFGRAGTGQFPGPDFEDGKLLFSDFLNLFVFNAKEGIGAVMKALSNKGLFQSLAEPNLIAVDGKEASFLAGGEYPYPVATPTSGAVAISIMFKEFGVRLNFTPTILGDEMVRLKVRPEVSALDFSNAITLEGFRVPALSTRRTETEVELQNGQTFAIAGLLNNTLNQSMSKVPGIGDIPILGLLFRSRAHQKNQTELVVMITPYIVRRGSHGVSEGLPNMVAPFIGPPNKTIAPPPAYTNSPRYGASQPGSEVSVQPKQAPAQQPAVSAPPQQPQRATQPVSPAPVQKAETPAAAAPQARAPSKKELKQIEEARKREQEQRALEAKRQAEAEKAAARAAAEQKKQQEEEARAALKKAEEDKKKLEAAASEQAKRDATVARKAAEDRKKAEEDRKKAEEQQKKLAAEEAKRQKALAEAEAKLKEAQSAYEAVVRAAPNTRPIP